MVTHIVMFRWSRVLTDEEHAQVHQAFEGLREITDTTDVRHGADLGRRDGNADHVAIVTTADWDSFLRYLAHPIHVHLVELTAGFTKDRWSVQADLPTTADIARTGT